MTFPRIFLLFPLFFIAFCHESIDSHSLPRPLILEYPENIEALLAEELRLECTSWRLAAETNNLSPWKTIPQECADYVKDYMNGREYVMDLRRVSEEAKVYANGVELSGDGMDVWIFDIDETLLSNLPYYAEHGYGLEIFDHVDFDKWVEKGMAPAIEPSLKLYEEVLGLGFKVFLLTGRSERHRITTVENLINAGFKDWHRLILRTPDENGKLAILYKSEKRSEMEKEGYRILGNSGDQWSDILGTAMSSRSFKLANPMYFIP
ncbi:hypothetical protein FNV43_RR25246 [Rhamnella rubrinervis]|uniref:Acid phosphatase n=1 Tax=Rhamnella rubrinervis TaxID=2594499 RepID=A0A8K0GRF9_9ROSA|nr:hypothetical protein FNV43_RR25246 [Rhamnella rubrinervis]